MPALDKDQAAANAPTVANPYHQLAAELRRLDAQLTSGTLSTSHVLIDLHRIVNDVINATATTFLSLPLPAPTPALSSLTHAPSVSAAVSTFLLKLRDANVLSISDDLAIRAVQSLTAFALSTGQRSVTVDRTGAALSAVQGWVEELDRAFEVQMKADSTGDQARGVKAAPLALGIIASAASAAAPAKGRPTGWSEEDWAAHCQPLWNTAVLDLQKDEEEQTERETALEEERRERLTAAKERAAATRERDRQRRQAEKDRAQAKREKAADRARRLEEGEIDAAEAKKEEEEEANEAVAAEDEEEKEEAIVVPPPVVKHVPISFCCVACHSVLLSSADIARVYANTVYSKAAAKPASLIRNTGEQWQQTPAEADAGAEVAEEEEAGGGEEAGKKADEAEESSAVYCGQCYAYVGRHLSRRDVYRLVYIDRLTGRNWMFVTGDIAALPQRLTPLLSKPATEEEEELANEEEGDGEATVKPVKAEDIPVIVGLPSSYTSVAQAVRYPFPRFPVPVIASTPAVANPNFPELTSTAIATLLSASPDPLYAVAGTGVGLTQVDPAFTSRLLLTVVTQHLLALFATFSSPSPSSPYHPPSASPIPPFTHFYLTPPELTHARGTSRYTFHYLTGKDDSKVKRHPWSLRRAKDLLGRHDCAVLMVMAGGWGGMRSVVVKVGEQWRVYQSNERVREAGRRYGLEEWVRDGGRWGGVLDGEDMERWWGTFERARRGERAAWEDLFCRGDAVLTLTDAPQDRFRESDSQFSVARLLPDNLHMN